MSKPMPTDITREQMVELLNKIKNAHVKGYTRLSSDPWKEVEIIDAILAAILEKENKNADDK